MIRPDSLTEMLAQRATTTPDRSAFRFADHEWRFDEVWRGAGIVAGRLVECGVTPGDRVVLTLANGPEFFFAFYGVLRACGIAVPMYPGSGSNRIAARMNRCGARIVVVPSDLDSDAAEALTTSCAAIGARVVVCPTTLEADPRDMPVPDDGASCGVAMLQFTSGSTGEPKGVQLTHSGLVTNARQMIRGMEITERDVFVSWLPVHHDMGLILMTIVPFLLGARLVLLPTSLTNTRTWLRTIADERGTFTAAPDFAYRLCLRTIRDPQAYDLTSLRLALNAAEPVRARTIDDFEATFGLDRVMVAGYGLAEATVGVTTWPPGTRHKSDERGLVSVGPPFPDVELKIVDDQGSSLPTGTIGRILVRSPANTPGYWQDQEATTAVMQAGGFLDTGDLGYLDKQGRLTVAGRAKNVIISGGRNLAPHEIEEITDDVDGVRRAAAIGIDAGDVVGEQPVVIAEVRPGRDDAYYQDLVITMVERLHAGLGLRPARVVLVAPHTIPRTANGKVQHQLLRQRYLDHEIERSGAIVFPTP